MKATLPRATRKLDFPTMQRHASEAVSLLKRIAARDGREADAAESALSRLEKR